MMTSAASSMHIKRGALLSDERYQVVREINRGGTAIVYEAVDVATKKQVALKVMHTQDGVLTISIDAVKREIEYASKVAGHENVVKLLDVFSEGTAQVVIVWELVSGMDLLDLLNQHGGRLSELDARRYFGQLQEGVCWIHNNGFCHRDLKAENVMIDTASNCLKIIDFGLTKHINSALTLGVGTPDYMAPEIIDEETTQKYDPQKVDVWAMGVILYLTVTGRYPFESSQNPNDVVSTLQNISSQPYRPLPPYISQPCADLIARMLDRDPGSRLTLDKIAEHEWSRKMQYCQQAPQTNGHTSADQLMSPASTKSDVCQIGRFVKCASSNDIRGDAPARDETSAYTELRDAEMTSCFASKPLVQQKPYSGISKMVPRSFKKGFNRLLFRTQ